MLIKGDVACIVSCGFKITKDETWTIHLNDSSCCVIVIQNIERLHLCFYKL